MLMRGPGGRRVAPSDPRRARETAKGWAPNLASASPHRARCLWALHVVTYPHMVVGNPSILPEPGCAPTAESRVRSQEPSEQPRERVSSDLGFSGDVGKHHGAPAHLGEVCQWGCASSAGWTQELPPAPEAKVVAALGSGPRAKDRRGQGRGASCPLRCARERGPSGRCFCCVLQREWFPCLGRGTMWERSPCVLP